MAEKNTNPTIDDLKAPLLAAVGAADLALERVNEIVTTLRERADEVRNEAADRVEERRARLNKLQDEIPSQVGELREKLNSEELRKAAEGYADAATSTYNKLIERGEAALERLRSQPALGEAADRVETYTDQAVELTQDARDHEPTGSCACRQEGSRQEGSGQEGARQEGDTEVGRFTTRM